MYPAVTQVTYVCLLKYESYLYYPPDIWDITLQTMHMKHWATWLTLSVLLILVSSMGDIYFRRTCRTVAPHVTVPSVPPFLRMILYNNVKISSKGKRFMFFECNKTNQRKLSIFWVFLFLRHSKHLLNKLSYAMLEKPDYRICMLIWQL